MRTVNHYEASIKTTIFLGTDKEIDATAWVKFNGDGEDIFSVITTAEGDLVKSKDIPDEEWTNILHRVWDEVEA